MEPPHTIEILPMRAVLIGLRFRVNAGRPNYADSIGDVIRPKTPGEDNRRLDKLDDASAYAPVMGDPKCTDLTVGFSMAVQQQVIDHPVVAAGAVDADLTDHRDASHDEHAV